MLNDFASDLFSHTFPALCSMGVLPVSLKIGKTYHNQDVEIYIRSVSKVVDEKRTKKPRKLPVIQGSMKRQGPRTWLKYGE